MKTAKVTEAPVSCSAGHFCTAAVDCFSLHSRIVCKSYVCCGVWSSEIANRVQTAHPRFYRRLFSCAGTTVRLQRAPSCRKLEATANSENKAMWLELGVLELPLKSSKEQVCVGDRKTQETDVPQ